MAYDIYGQHLAKGHCEVHPWVGEEYPCSLCYAESYAESKHKHDPQQKEYERMQAEHYAEIERLHCEELALRRSKINQKINAKGNSLLLYCTIYPMNLMKRNYRNIEMFCPTILMPKQFLESKHYK